ncbi:MAG: HAMP domain-containing histidine kinase [Saprospiraceae bacterium]|nr:HAMP domain-containing histidine kinase [Saprospiraceae bacterium]
MSTTSKRTRRLFVLSSLIIIYMILALVWWSVLLLRNNDEDRDLRAEILRLESAEGPAVSDIAHQKLAAEYRRQKLMIIGEGAVFSLALLTGMWFINRGYSREIQLEKQKRNFGLAVTHELKSPLASIRIVLETLKKRELEPAQVDKLMTHGLTETQRLSELVENLLLSAKLDKSYKIYPELVDLTAMTQEISNNLIQKYPEATVNLQNTGIPVEGYFDRHGISSVLRNLLENAMKYGQSSEPIEVKLESDEKWILFQIIDHGTGISPEDRPFIFRQFYRSGSEETRKTKGTGLGLYIVKKLIDLHHGTIVLTQTIPEGTTITIRLPRKPHG